MLGGVARDQAGHKTWSLIVKEIDGFFDVVDQHERHLGALFPLPFETELVGVELLSPRFGDGTLSSRDLDIFEPLGWDGLGRITNEVKFRDGISLGASLI